MEISASQCEYNLDLDVDNMCRICMSQTDTTERLFNIFASAIVDGFLVHIPDVIRFCLDLKVKETDGMPSKICQKCKGQLLNFYVFKQKCKRTEQVLQQAFGKSEDRKSPLSQIETLENEKPSSSSASEMVEILDSGHHLEEAETEPNDSLVDPFQCELCDKTFLTEEELKQHMTCHCDGDENDITSDKQQDVEQEDQASTADSNKSEEFADGIVKEEDIHYMDTEELEESESTAHYPNDQGEYLSDSQVDVSEIKYTQNSEEVPEDDEEIIGCSICGKSIKGRSRHSRHMRSHESNRSIIEFFSYHICNVCSTAYLQNADLEDHITSTDHSQNSEDASQEDSAKPYICGVCLLEHDRIDYMKQHLLSHMNSFSCPFDGCGCEYVSLARLGIHITNKHIEYDSPSCQHCGVDSFESMAELQQHLRTKCTGKKFPCDHCDKKFLTARSLAQHLRCLEKKHRCDDCGKTFAQHGELKLHQRMHNGERPFKCTVCGKCYKTASLRTAHMDSHIEGKTFQCNLCGKQLQTRTCYRNHIKRHSEERKFGCDICSKKFYTKYNVKIHKEKVHKLKPGGTKDTK